MSPSYRFFVKAEWDAEAEVWYVAETNVAGLSLEARTPDDLLKRLDCAVPELLALNGVFEQEHMKQVPYELMLKRFAESRADCG